MSGSRPDATDVNASGPETWPNFLLYPQVFSDEECDTVIDIGVASRVSHGSELGGIEGVQEAGELRDSAVTWVPRSQGSEWVFARLEELAASANQSWGLDIDGIGEDLQYTCYEQPGDHYTWHHDGLDIGVQDRKLSLVVQLSDPGTYEGADLEFLEVAVDYDSADRAEYLEQCRGRGTVIAFCSFEYHRVTPLLGGERQSLVAWLSGPPLR